MTTKTFFPPWKAVFDDGRIFIYDSNHNVVALLDYKSQTREARELDAALIARAPELLTENEELKERIDELESEAEVISAEFEGEMWRGVRSILLKDCGWSGDCFPATPDDALQGLQEEMRYRSDEVVRLKSRIAELEAERTWQPIETAPKDGTGIVGMTAHGTTVSWIADGYMDGDRWTFASFDLDEDEYSTPTHWMPLPKMTTPETPTG